jgi:hypothetical protein
MRLAYSISGRAPRDGPAASSALDSGSIRAQLVNHQPDPLGKACSH